MVKKTRTLDLGDSKRVVEKEMEEKLSVLKGDVAEAEKPKKGRKRLETVAMPVEDVVEEVVEEVPKSSGRADASQGTKKESKEEPKKEEKPVVLEETTKAYFEEMMTNYLKNYKPPVVEPPNVVMEKKTRTKKTAVVDRTENTKVPKVTKKAPKVAKKTVMEEANEDMLRAEYEKELRRRMMNTLFDY